jgi:peptide/nickel transport system permease protein
MRWRGVAVLPIVVLVLVLGTALFGPWFAPHNPDSLLGVPLSGPSREFPFGTDILGRDVLSRVLAGGRSLVLLAALSTAIAYGIGATIGLVAGYTRTFLDDALMRTVDVLQAFPALLFLLVLTTGIGAGVKAIVIGVAVVQVPGVARIIRAATLEVSVRGYVTAATARGERRAYILYREILPNIMSTVVADAGPRFTGSILLVASLNFFGIGIPPPHADWGLMISENREGMTLQPWAVAVPAIMIALLTISTNSVADSLARRLGRGTSRTAVKAEDPTKVAVHG